MLLPILAKIKNKKKKGIKYVNEIDSFKFSRFYLRKSFFKEVCRNFTENDKLTINFLKVRALLWYCSSVIWQKGESQNGGNKNTSTPNFPKNERFLPPFAILPTCYGIFNLSSIFY